MPTLQAQLIALLATLSLLTRNWDRVPWVDSDLSSIARALGAMGEIDRALQLIQTLRDSYLINLALGDIKPASAEVKDIDRAINWAGLAGKI